MITTEKKALDVTLIEPKRKHPVIFEEFDKLQMGENLIIRNDHEPKPLYYQLLFERGNIFEWTYLEKGPQIWLVDIKKSDELKAGESIGEIAASDIRKAEIFKKYGLDFCCGGKKSLESACVEQELDPEQIRKELNNVDEVDKSDINDYNSWEMGYLVDHIVNKHHKYVCEQLPVIKELAQKVENAHAEFHPELLQINKLVLDLNDELSAHLQKEERVLFPYIKQLLACESKLISYQRPMFDSIERPINMMEVEHESAGEMLAEISSLSSGYKLPADACNSYRLLFNLLQDFDNDLKIHIHLENNILFPKALKLEKKLAN